MVCFGGGDQHYGYCWFPTLFTILMKRVFFVTKLGTYTSIQTVHEADDLHELCVDILQVLPHRTEEYSDTEVIRLMTNKDSWDETYYLITEYNPVKRMVRDLVKDQS